MSVVDLGALRGDPKEGVVIGERATPQGVRRILFKQVAVEMIGAQVLQAIAAAVTLQVVEELKAAGVIRKNYTPQLLRQAVDGR